MQTQAMTLFNGVLCFAAMVVMLRIIYFNWDFKKHPLKVFQYGYCAMLLLIGVHHVTTYISYRLNAALPNGFNNIYYSTDIIAAVLVIPYFIYQKQKHIKQHEAKNY